MKKKYICLCISAVLAAAVLTACGRKLETDLQAPKETEVQTTAVTEELLTEVPMTEVSSAESQTETFEEEMEPVTLQAYVLALDGTAVILGDADGGLYQMETADTDAALQAGMAVDVVYSGILMRNIPASIPQIESVTVVEDRENPYAFYQTLLQNIWDTKPELNEGIEFVALDLSEAENIQEHQKYVLEYVMRTICQCEVQLTTDDQLEQEGILADEPDRFVDRKGMLISIDDERRNGDQILFDAEKWISDTEEVEWDDSTAAYENGVWNIVTMQ